MNTYNTCRSCSEPIIWAETQSGKRTPMNMEPDQKMGRFLLEETQREIPLARFVKGNADATFGQPLYRSHFETCPDGIMWKKKKGTEDGHGRGRRRGGSGAASKTGS